MKVIEKEAAVGKREDEKALVGGAEVNRPCLRDTMKQDLLKL